MMGLGSNDSGVHVTEKGALSLSTVFRAVTVLSAAIAAVPKHIYRKQNGKREMLTNHPAQQLIAARTTPFSNAFNFWMMAMGHVLLWGNHYSLIKRDAFMNPVELLPFPPGVIKPMLTTTGLVYYDQLTHKTYTQDEVFHIKDFTTDGIEGHSRIKLHRQMVGTNMAQERYQAAFFGRGTHQGGIIELPDDMNLGDTPEEEEAELSRLRRSIGDTYSGPENYYKIMMLEKGMKFTPTSMPMADAQFLELRGFGVKETARVYGVPLSKLMDLDRAIQSNMEQQGIEFVQELLPWAVNIEQEVNAKLLRESEKETTYTKLNLDGLVRADIKTRYEAYSIALGQRGPGFRSPDEIREMEDLNPIEATELFKPMNFNRQNETNAA